MTELVSCEYTFEELYRSTAMETSLYADWRESLQLLAISLQLFASQADCQ
jgi:hypothetical protein